MGDWAGYTARRPIGFAASDLLNAHLMSFIARALGTKDASLADFILLPDEVEEVEKDTEKQLDFLLGTESPPSEGG